MIELFEASVILRMPATSAVFKTACVTKAVVLVTASDLMGKSFSVLESESCDVSSGRLVDVRRTSAPRPA